MLVIGPGPMGILAAQVARALGGVVTVVGLRADADRLAIARDLGFETRHDEPDPGSFDAAVDASGSGAGLRVCLEAVRRGGRLVQIGIFGRDVHVPLDRVLEKEIEVSSGFASTPRSWRRALRLIELGRVELEPLITRASPLAEWETAFADLRGGRAMKIVLDPRL